MNCKLLVVFIAAPGEKRSTTVQEPDALSVAVQVPPDPGKLPPAKLKGEERDWNLKLVAGPVLLFLLITRLMSLVAPTAVIGNWREFEPRVNVGVAIEVPVSVEDAEALELPLW